MGRLWVLLGLLVVVGAAITYAVWPSSSHTSNPPDTSAAVVQAPGSSAANLLPCRLGSPEIVLSPATTVPPSNEDLVGCGRP